MLMNMDLRSKIGREEFDYQTLMGALSGYASPRDRVTSLLRSGAVIRIKKGLYVFGEPYRRQPYCRELLANLIYGPSIVSLKYALGFYGLIPERVEALTSVTSGRARRFVTPAGLFIYRSTPSLSIGVDRLGDDDRRFLIASPERAVGDMIREERSGTLRTQKDVERYLFSDLRMTTGDLRGMNADFMDELAVALRSRKVGLCAALIHALRRK